MTDQEWKPLFEEAMKFLDAQEIPFTDPPKRRSVTSSTLQGSEVSSTLGHRSTSDVSEHGLRKFFNSVVKLILEELSLRFSSQNTALLKAIWSCCPASGTFLDFAELSPLIAYYGLDEDVLEYQLPTARKFLLETELIRQKASIVDVLQALGGHGMVSEVAKLLTIAATIPVSNATCERSFSALKRIKTYLRNTMGQERLSSMALLAIEKDVAEKLNLDDIVEVFRLIKVRRMAL